MLHWLPAHVLQTLPPMTVVDCPYSVTTLPDATALNYTASFNFDGKNSYSRDNHDRSAPALPTIPPSVTSLDPRPPSTKIIPFPCPPPTNINICKIYSQNVHGLWYRAQDPKRRIIPNCERDTTKLEHLVHQMRVDNIDAWLVQETWLEDDDYDTIIGGYHLFQNNSPVGSTGHCHLFRGVAIILSPRFYLAWKAAGSQPLITMDPAGKFAGWFLGLNLKFDLQDSRGRQVKGKSLNLLLASVYHLCHDVPHEAFIEHLQSILYRVPPNAQLIIRANVNAKLGHRNSDELAAVLGPHGPPRCNIRGSNLLALYLSHNLCVENTFFDAPFPCTYANIGTKDGTIIDIFACAKRLHCCICNCPAVTDGVESDHSAVRLDLALTLFKHLSSTALVCRTTDWCKIVEDRATNTRYNNLLLTATDNGSMLCKDFHNKIKKVGAKTALLVKSKGNDWFLFNQYYLAPLIDKHNQLIHAFHSSANLPSSIINVMCDALTCLNKNIKGKVLIAKARWAAHLCPKVHNMAMNPRLVWERICVLTGSSNAHHKNSVPMAMKMPDGNVATNGKENMSVFGPHFDRVFNNHRPVDLIILDEFAQ
jgi:hypothetical protein